VDFSLKIASKTGVGKAQVIATSGNYTSTYELELNIRNPNPPLTTFTGVVLKPEIMGNRL